VGCGVIKKTKQRMIKNALLLVMIAVTMTLSAQSVSTFENIDTTSFWTRLDTFWNGSTGSGGVASGNAYYTNSYDTSFGGSWSGFAVSSMRNDTTAGFGNQYSTAAKTGHAGSAHYGVAYTGNPVIRLTGAAKSKTVLGCYITNSTFAYQSMKRGDNFAKKFGGTTGKDPDWFRLSISGWLNGTALSQHVDFYLADYRDADSTKDYIIKDWTWVDLSSLCHVDSLSFQLNSTDTGAFGINTPTYFCIDDLTSQDYEMITASTRYTDTLRIPGYTITGMLSSPQIPGASASLVGNTLVYTPALGLVATDTILCTVCNSCGQCSPVPVVITVRGITGVQDVPAIALSVYPNPTNSSISIHTDVQIKSVHLADLAGQTMLHTDSLSIDGMYSLSDLAAGMYLLSVTTTVGTATQLIVKQ
jgi:hypothetical protein